MFTYDMPKVVRVRNKTLGILNRLLRMLLLCYFLIFVMWWNKSYQRTDKALSGVMTKINGVGTIDLGLEDVRIWVLDEAEFTLQSIQNSGFFIITRISDHTLQHLGQCAEARDLEDAFCETDRHCIAHHTGGQSIRSPVGYLPDGWELDIEADAHGIFTGRCQQATRSCEIYGWCPVHEDLDTLHKGMFKTNRSVVELADQISSKRSQLPDELFADDMFKPITEVLNFTVFIKNTIEFPYFDVARQNVLDWMNETYLRTCLYNRNHKQDSLCPNFRIKDILDLSGGNTSRLLRHGGSVAITIKWKCDLDLPIKRCLPRYDFYQLDGSEYSSNDHLALGEGWPMEISRSVGRHGRLLIRVNGIQFWIIVDGEATKFNLFIFTMSFGSNLALLSLASIVCDYLLFNCTRERKRYLEATHQICKSHTKSIAVQTEANEMET